MVKKPVKSAESQAAQRDFQDQKNHQDFVYQTNTGLQDLSLAIKNLWIFLHEFEGKTHSNHKALQIELENHNERMANKAADIEKRVSAHEMKYVQLSERVKNAEDQLRANIGAREFLVSVAEDNAHEIVMLRDLVSRRDQQIAASLNQFNSSHVDRLERIKNDLTALIEREDPFAAKIEEKLRVYKQDFDSLYKEMTNLKLAFACVQKKFEVACRIDSLSNPGAK